MTYTNEPFERRVRDWLQVEAAVRMPDHLDTVLSGTSVQHQRPAWSSLERWLPVDTTFRPRFINLPQPGRLALIAGALVLLLILAAVAIGSRQQRLPAPFGPARNGILMSSADGDIYAIDPVTGTRRAVIGGPEFDFGVLFSRDGTKFIVLRNAPTDCGKNDCGLILMVANADGSGLRDLTTGLPALDWQDWSPDGKRIVIDSLAPSGVGHVMSVVNVDGSGITKLDVGQPVHEMSWRPPDGNEIVFRGEREGAPGIYAVRPDGTGLRTLSTRPATSDGDFQDIAVSPDGNLVAYRDDVAPVHLHILDLRDGQDRTLDGAGQSGATFSPDGTKIAFLRQSTDGSHVQLVVASLDGSQPAVALGPPSGFTRDGPSINNYSWSPDGNAILASYELEKVARLIPIDGSAPTDLVHGELALPGYQRLAP